MPAMHDLVLEGMNNRLAYLRDIMLRTLTFDMTHAECMQLVAPSDHIDILTKASEFANVSASEDWMHLSVPGTIDGYASPIVALMMRTHAEQTPPLMPRTPVWRAGQSGHKVISWLTKRFEIGRRFGTARYVLNALNRECENGHQLRFMFPPVLHLCKPGRSERMDKWMAKHAAYKACKHAPAVSREMKLAIQDSSALLTSMALIGEDVLIPTPGFVDIGTTEMGAFEIDRNLVRRM